MSYGIKRISSWMDDVRSGVYQIRLISTVTVYGGKTVGPDAALWIILEIRGRWGLVSEDIQRTFPGYSLSSFKAPRAGYATKKMRQKGRNSPKKKKEKEAEIAS